MSRRETAGGSPDGDDASRSAPTDLGERLRGGILTHARAFGVGLFSLGSIAFLTAWYVSDRRAFLLSVGLVATFGGFLAYYLDSDRFVTAAVARDVYEAVDRNEAGLLETAELSDRRVYVPTPETVYLYVPADPTDVRPPGPYVTVPQLPDGDAPGAALVPTGLPLLERVRDTLEAPLSDDPRRLADQTEAGLLHTLELVRTADVEVDADAGRLTVTASDAVFPPGFDSPAASFVGVTLAAGLGRPIVTEISGTDRSTLSVTCRWDPAAAVPDT